jgi:glycosyltransferase involved in cell wall biosynthesis
MKKPVVLLLGKLPPPYMGPSIATSILLQSSLNEHFQLVHLDTRAHRSLESMGRWSVSKVFRTLFIYSRLKWLIVRYWPKVILIPVSQSTLGFFKDAMYLIIAKSFFRKTIFHLRGSNFRNWYLSSSPLNQWFVRSMLKLVNGVIVQGERLKPVFRDLVPEYRIHVVPNGADYPVSPDYRRHTPFEILYLANLQASKGIEDVLEAVKLLIQNPPGDFILRVVGAWRSDEMKRTCTDFVSRNRLPVKFFPAVEAMEKFDFMKQADAFVFTPREPEGHPWVIVEAQAAGLPVIATAQGAIPEAVKEGVNGFIVNVKSPGEIADRLRQLMSNEPLRQEFAHQSRSTYLKEYTEKKMVERMTSALEAVMNG